MYLENCTTGPFTAAVGALLDFRFSNSSFSLPSSWANISYAGKNQDSRQNITCHGSNDKWKIYIVQVSTITEGISWAYKPSTTILTLKL